MTKKIIFFAMFVLFSNVLFAQGFELGIKGGADVQQISGVSFKEEFAYGYHLGAYTEIKLSKTRAAAWGLTNVSPLRITAASVPTVCEVKSASDKAYSSSSLDNFGTAISRTSEAVANVWNAGFPFKGGKIIGRGNDSGFGRNCDMNGGRGRRVITWTKAFRDATMKTLSIQS